MPGTLFELYATLGLDTTDFKDEADKAVEKGEEVAKEVKEAFEETDTSASNADEKLDNLKTKSDTTQAILNGFLSATGQFVEELIQGIIEFGAQSIEAASQTGSAMAEEYLAAQDKLSASTEALKVKVGNILLPIATLFSNLGSELLGISDQDRLLVMLDQIDGYAFDNLSALRADLDGVFGLFQEAEYGDEQNAGDMLAGLQSQIDYWNEYAAVLESVKWKGLDASFVAEIADGSATSLEKLRALANADEETLATISESYQAVETAKEGVAQGLNEIQLSVDKDFQSMQNSVNSLAENMNSEDAYNASLALGNSISTGLAEAYPAIAEWVDTIIAKMQSLSASYNMPYFYTEFGEPYPNPAYVPGFASGLNYVPYDNYRAELHKGEAVLPRHEAEEYRAGKRGAGADPAQIASAMAAALNGATVQMDGATVGKLVTGQVSKEIARQTKTSRRYG